MDKHTIASKIRSLANRVASSPFNMTEVELELYHNLDKLHDILLETKEETNKYFDDSNTERDPVLFQGLLDGFDEDVRKLPKSTEGFSNYMIQADQVIARIYDAVKMNDMEAVTEAKADLDLLAGKIYAEHQKLRSR